MICSGHRPEGTEHLRAGVGKVRALTSDQCCAENK